MAAPRRKTIDERIRELQARKEAQDKKEALKAQIAKARKELKALKK